jgi:hypothetical protein
MSVTYLGVDCIYLTLGFGNLVKNWDFVCLLPVTKLCPYYVCFAFMRSYLQIGPMPYEFIHQSWVVTLINKNLKLLIFSKPNPTDSMIIEYILQKSGFDALLFLEKGSIFMKLSCCKSLFETVFLSWKFTTILRSNKIQGHLLSVYYVV